MNTVHPGPLIGLLFAVTLSSASIAAWNYHRMSVRVVELEHAQRTLSSLSSEFVRRAEFDQALRQARLDALQRLEEISREDSPDAAWLNQPIPERVRDAARLR